MTDPGFADILAANTTYAQTFHLGGLSPQAAKGLGVLTCIDSRIEPLTMLGLEPGDAKILRNAGARVTDDALRSLVLAVHFLSVRRIAVIQHTRCKMTEASNAELRHEITALTHEPTDHWDFHAIEDQSAVLVDDIDQLRKCRLIPDTVEIAGLIYDVDSGLLRLECTA
ncbi:MAG: carbonic anhydrase [Acidimicrobiia bacterium]|nr:carbonic anhydrase [Acidimicrobiia bacterium]